jgi:hypothetical protein
MPVYSKERAIEFLKDRHVEELAQEELAALRLRTPYELIVENFIRSGKDFKTIRVPEGISGLHLYHGISNYIRACKLENVVDFYARKLSPEFDTITLMRTNGEEAQRHPKYHLPKKR